MSIDGVIGDGPCDAASVQRKRDSPIAVAQNCRRAEQSSPVESESCARASEMSAETENGSGEERHSPRTAWGQYVIRFISG